MGFLFEPVARKVAKTVNFRLHSWFITNNVADLTIVDIEPQLVHVDLVYVTFIDGRKMIYHIISW
jgi:hypothetical protein